MVFTSIRIKDNSTEKKKRSMASLIFLIEKIVGTVKVS